MNISIWALIISFFLLVGSIPSTIYLYREILELTQGKNSSSYLLAGYVSLLLINIGIGTFLVTNILSMEVDYGGMFFGLGGLGLFVVIACVIILLTILAESATTLYFLQKYTTPTLLEIILVWVIILSVIVTALVGGVLYWQHDETINIKSPNIEVGNKAKDSSALNTSDWKVYTNKENGYRIRYPNNFKVEQSNYGVEFLSEGVQECEEEHIEGYPYCPTFIFIHSEEVPSEETLKSWLKQHLDIKKFESFQITPEESNWGTDCVQKTTIGKNIQGYKVHRWRQAWGECHYYIKHSDLIVNIQRADAGLDCSSCSSVTFDKMLSTFEFINSKE